MQYTIHTHKINSSFSLFRKIIYMHISYRDVSYRYYEYDIRDLNFDIDILLSL